jgi:Sugar (and other) transporter
MYSVAWYFLPENSCEVNLQPCLKTADEAPCCNSADNRGWRYFIAALGLFTIFMFICRFFLFQILESPKFLLSRNKHSEAVQVVQRVAHYNGTRTWLDEATLEHLAGEDSSIPGLTLSRVGKKNLEQYSISRVHALFSTWKVGIATLMLWTIWLT